MSSQISQRRTYGIAGARLIHAGCPSLHPTSSLKAAVEGSGTGPGSHPGISSRSVHCMMETNKQMNKCDRLHCVLCCWDKYQSVPAVSVIRLSSVCSIITGWLWLVRRNCLHWKSVTFATPMPGRRTPYPAFETGPSSLSLPICDTSFCGLDAQFYRS